MGHCRFSDVRVNEHPLFDGSIGKLRGLMEHDDSVDLHHWFEKKNRYTTMEAISRFEGHALAVEPRVFGTPLERRMFLEGLLPHIPLRYQMQWLHEVLVRGAWRSGRLGLRWVQQRVQVRRQIELKYEEMKHTGLLPFMRDGQKRDYAPRLSGTEAPKRFRALDSQSS